MASALHNNPGGGERGVNVIRAAVAVAEHAFLLCYYCVLFSTHLRNRSGIQKKTLSPLTTVHLSIHSFIHPSIRLSRMYLCTMKWGASFGSTFRLIPRCKYYASPDLAPSLRWLHPTMDSHFLFRGQMQSSSIEVATTHIGGRTPAVSDAMEEEREC